MAIQEFVNGEEFKKLIEDKLVNASSVKYVLKSKGIIPICTSPANLADSVQHLFLGSGTMTQIHEVMNFDQNSLKSTMVVINPITDDNGKDFTTDLADEFVKMQRLPNSHYQLKNVHKESNGVFLQYYYEKPQKGRIKIASTKPVTLDINITPIEDGQYKVNIRHEGMSESKQFLSLLDEMVSVDPSEKIFNLKRLTLRNLQKNNKVDFFDNFGSLTHKEWKLLDITNVTVNQNERVIEPEDQEDDLDQELTENEPSGKLSGISSAILSGGGLRNNEFVKDCMAQGFIFSSMRYKFQHKTLPTIVELEINFKQKDLKINIIKTMKTEDDGKDYKTPLPVDEQNSIIDYFQNQAYKVYSDLIDKQRQQLEQAD